MTVRYKNLTHQSGLFIHDGRNPSIHVTYIFETIVVQNIACPWASMTVTAIDKNLFVFVF